MPLLSFIALSLAAPARIVAAEGHWAALEREGRCEAVVASLSSAVKDNDGNVMPSLFADKLFNSNIWSLGCLYGSGNCGVAWNTVAVATLVGLLCTVLGLALALIALRTQVRGKWILRSLSILPIITPPFVIGLALILLFGRAGIVTNFLSHHFAIPRSRWIYGMAGITMAQVLAFTPIAFLVLVGVLQGVSPSMEEASQTLRASRWRTFWTVTWPLIRPGLASAFLISFIESMADFANPLVLGGNFNVLATDIFFAVVGAAHVPGMTAQIGQPVDRAELDRIPPPALWWRIAKWVIPLAFVGLLAYLATQMNAATFAKTMLAWIIPTSLCAGAATLVTGGSLFTVISAIVAAPIARLYPLVRTAVVVGIVEAWRRKPSVQDCERLQDDVETMKGFWRNPVTRILIIAVSGSLGALLGFAVGVGVFATRL